MCQNLMILARMGDLRTRPALGASPPLVLRCSSGLSRRPFLCGLWGAGTMKAECMDSA
jgi:hypothetical protein